MWRGKRPRIGNTILKESKIGALDYSTSRLSYNDKDTAVLAKEEICRSMEQNREPINIVNWSFTKEQRQCNGEKMVFSTSAAGKTGHPQSNKWIKTENLHISLKNWLKMDHRSKCKTKLYNF